MINSTQLFLSADKTSKSSAVEPTLSLDESSVRYSVSTIQLSLSGGTSHTLLLSDDNTTGTASTSFTSSITTEEKEGDKEEKNHIDKEEIIQIKPNDISFFHKRIESLEHENRRIQQDLKIREQEVGALVKRCDSQGKIIKDTRETKVMAKEIEQLSNEIKRKDVNIGKLTEELTKTKKEATRALQEVKEVEVRKCKEISMLQDTVTDLKRKSDTFSDEVAKLKVDTISKDTELKDAQSAVISMINSKIEREDMNQSLHSQVQLLHSSALKIENDQLKIHSAKQNVAELEQLAKIAVVKDETIEQLKGYCTEMGQELAERELLIDEMAHQKHELEDKLKDSQFRLQEIQVLRPVVDNLKGNDSKSNDSDNGADCKTLKTDISTKRTTFSRMLSNLNTMRKIANEKDEIIEQKNACCSDMEMQLAEKSRIIDETVTQKNELKDDLRQAHSLAMELEESQLCLQEINGKVAELKKQGVTYSKQQKSELLPKEKSPKKRFKHSRLKKLSSKMLLAKASQLRPSLGSTKVMMMNSAHINLSALDNDDDDDDNGGCGGGEESNEA